ncbi:MAG TPA: hypothetical protein VF519_00360 [Mycobacteriales bacterium]
MIAAVCHGTPRRPHEPYGAMAPLVRAAAWALMTTAGVLLVLIPVQYAVGFDALIGPTLGLAGLAGGFAISIRIIAMGLRPTEVVLALHLADDE